MALAPIVTSAYNLEPISGTRVVSKISTLYVNESRVDSNSHADTCVTGKNSLSLTCMKG